MSVVGDISDESVDSVSSSVGGFLEYTVRKRNHETTSNDTISIMCVYFLEVCLPVVISSFVLIGIGLRGKPPRSIGGRGSYSENCGEDGGGD